MQVVEALNRLYDRSTGGDTRPVFFDLQETYPALAALDRAYPVIRAELEEVLPSVAQMPKYQELDPRQTYITTTLDPGRNWRVFLLYAYGEKPEENRRRCPRTTALLDGVPGLVQAFFSILEPGKSIAAHSAAYRGYLRYHLGLLVPARNPPRLIVKDREHVWEEGKSLLFDDTWQHHVVNESDGYRVVLLVDVRRPMPALQRTVNRLVLSTLGRQYGKQLMEMERKATA
jgi:aspartyl/asparaginyl beta-hydroxylase (cupin superfamily)